MSVIPLTNTAAASATVAVFTRTNNTFLVLLFTVVFPISLFVDLIAGNIDPQFFTDELATSFEGNLGTIFTVYFLLIIGAIYIYMSYAFVLPLIVDAKLDFWQAMETSRRTVVTCFLGIFVVIPYIYCVIFAAYDDILNPQSEGISEQISDFGVQEKDINTESEDDDK